MPNQHTDDTTRLWLYEEALLIALRDDSGKVHNGTWLSVVLGGALLAELIMMERVEITGAEKATRATVRDGSPTGNELLDECLAKMGESKKLRKPSDWVGKFQNLKDLKHRAADGLVQLGALERTEEKVLLVFPVTRYPEADPTLEGEVLKRIGHAIFETDAPVEDSRTAALIALLQAGDMLKIPFDKKELKARKNRLESIASGDAAGAAVKAAIEAIQTAVMVAIVASSAAAAAG